MRARSAWRRSAHQIDAIDAEIAAIDEEIKRLVKADETARRLMTIPGVGPITASAIVATVPDTSAFASGREFAAFLGLTPRQHSSGGKERLGRITKMGDRYLRKLLVVGACAALCHRKGHNDALRVWATAMLARKTVKYKFKLTAVALRQQGRAHRLRADDARRRIRRAAGRGLKRKRLPSKEFRRKAIRDRG